MVEVYKGIRIAISTAETSEKNWTSRAKYEDSSGDSVQLAPTDAAYATEEEARRGALQAAIENIDSRRVSTGKY